MLERYYGQLLEWGALLTRGDAGKAQDIVHDFCLHFALTQPDLSGIANLKGYLYTCLRHIYLSGLARSSREALQFVSIAEFDSFQFVLTQSRPGDALQRQNDLRRVCCYSVWRKAQTKSASYFVLRFFHGYHHQEIADLACSSISVIYNKLRTARAEVQSYLDGPSKLQFTSREFSPTPTLQWNLLSSVDLFKELRKTILDARTGSCLPADELVACYRSDHPSPISCSLLSHIVSCERCLLIIDQNFRRPTLKDREPLDSFGTASDDMSNKADKSSGASRAKLLRAVQKQKTEVLEHRPSTLSIAVDGKILASHDVGAQKNVFSARIERPENARFVEVFSEQGIRLALLSIGDLPPEGPHRLMQRVLLSDDRSLHLGLSFDGLGLQSEVTYFDPALAAELTGEDASDVSPGLLTHAEARRSGNVLSWPDVSTLSDSLRRLLRPMALSPVTAWSFVLACIFGVAGYLVYRDQKPFPVLKAREVLSQSIESETASMRGKTEHQAIQIEIANEDGAVRQHGTIELWKDADGVRYIRRLYNEQHQLIAAEWRQHYGRQGQYRRSGAGSSSDADSELLQENLWKWDISSSAFSESAQQNVTIRPLEDGYELLTNGPTSDRPQLISAALVLDHKLHAIREIMHLYTRAGIREVRFVQADYELQSSTSVPDAMFELQKGGVHSSRVRGFVAPGTPVTDIQLTELHIAVLYQLSNLTTDASEQIEARRTQNGYIQVSGIVADEGRKKIIVYNLNRLKNCQLVKIRLVTPHDIQTHSAPAWQTAYEPVHVYDLRETRAPADAALRKHFQTQGLSGEALDAAVAAFSHVALEHAQRALQHASALERLGSSFSASELTSVNILSQQQWTEMVAKYAAAFQVESLALQGQLAQLAPANEPQPRVRAPLSVSIDNPAQFTGAASQLLHDTQTMNQQINNTFAIHGAGNTHSDPDAMLESVRSAIPVEESEEVASFAIRLNASALITQMNQQNARVAKSRP